MLSSVEMVYGGFWIALSLRTTITIHYLHEMLTFFRTIRKSFFERGSTGRYLLYAVGEIALVVIGILIALQINNWNEWRKDRKKEILVLNEISATLAENIDVMDSLLVYLQERVSSGEIVISTIDGKKAYADSLDRHFFQASWLQVARISGGISMEGYEYLKNQGFDLIVNDDLRRRIISMFEKSIGMYNSRWENYQRTANHNINHLRELFFTPVESHDNPYGSWKPFDYDRLLEDNYYYSIAAGYQAFRKVHYKATKELRNQTNLLLQLIMAELGKEKERAN